MPLEEVIARLCPTWQSDWILKGQGLGAAGKNLSENFAGLGLSGDTMTIARQHLAGKLVVDNTSDEDAGNRKPHDLL